MPQTEPRPSHPELDNAPECPEPWPVRAYAEDGTTQLDPDETSSSPDPPEDLVEQARQDWQLASSWRHSHWQRRRARTYRAFKALELSPARIERFRACGSAAFIMKAKGREDTYCISSNRCHDRWCEACQREKRRALAAKFADRLPPGRLRFLTLTLRANDDTLDMASQRIYSGWSRLRAALTRKKLLTGGVAFLEITRNVNTKRWHPHLHCICQGKYLPHKLVMDLWYQITTDSYIVDVREIKDPETAAKYVLKYAGKAVNRSVWNDDGAMAELVQTMSGKRTFNTFGTWHGIGLLKQEPSAEEWEFVCTLGQLLRDYDAHKPGTTAILRQLVGDSAPENLDLWLKTHVHRGEPPP